MVAAALLVVSLPSAGYAAGQTEEELARQIQAYVPGVGVDDILAGAREWSAESGQDVRTVLELWNRLVTIRPFNAGRGFQSADQVFGILSCVSRTTKVTYSMSLCGQPGT